MILEGCQTIQWRRHFDPPPPLSILPFPFLPSFFSSLLPSEFSVSSSTSFRIERFWRNKATCSLFHSCFREHVWWASPFSSSPPSYRGEVSFPGFCPRFHRLDIRVEGNILACIRVSDIVWEIPPNFWIAICVLCVLFFLSVEIDLVWIFNPFQFFLCDY